MRIRKLCNIKIMVYGSVRVAATKAHIRYMITEQAHTIHGIDGFGFKTRYVEWLAK